MPGLDLREAARRPTSMRNVPERRRIVELVRRAGPRELAVDRGRRALYRIRRSRIAQEARRPPDVERRRRAWSAAAGPTPRHAPSASIRPSSLASTSRSICQSVPLGRADLETAEVALLRNERVGRDVDLRPGLVGHVRLRLRGPSRPSAPPPRREAVPAGMESRASRATRRPFGAPSPGSDHVAVPCDLAAVEIEVPSAAAVRASRTLKSLKLHTEGLELSRRRDRRRRSASPSVRPPRPPRSRGASAPASRRH